MTLTRDEQIDALTEGARLAVRDYLTAFTPDLSGLIHDAIKQGVVDAFPFPSEITNAIADGVKDAMEGR